jgi:hypothetical protein
LIAKNKVDKNQIYPSIGDAQGSIQNSNVDMLEETKGTAISIKDQDAGEDGEMDLE